MKKIYIVNGKPRSGKDTFAELLGKHCRVFKYSSVDKVKQIAAKCGWDGGKTDKDRRFRSFKLAQSYYVLLNTPLCQYHLFHFLILLL